MLFIVNVKCHNQELQPLNGSCFNWVHSIIKFLYLIEFNLCTTIIIIIVSSFNFHKYNWKNMLKRTVAICITLCIQDLMHWFRPYQIKILPNPFVCSTINNLHRFIHLQAFYILFIDSINFCAVLCKFTLIYMFYSSS